MSGGVASHPPKAGFLQARSVTSRLAARPRQGPSHAGKNGSFISIRGPIAKAHARWRAQGGQVVVYTSLNLKDSVPIVRGL